MALTAAQLDAHVARGVLGGMPGPDVWLELGFVRALVTRAIRYGRAGGADEREAAVTLVRRLYAAGGWGPVDAPGEAVRAWAATFLPGTAEFHSFTGSL